MTEIESSQKHYIKLITLFLGLMCSVLFVFILISLKTILVPFTIAIFLTFLFHPVLLFLVKNKIPKSVAIILMLILFSGIYYLFTLLIVSSLSQLPQKLPFYSARLTGIIEGILLPFKLTVNEAAQMFQIQIEKYDLFSLFEGLLNAGIIEKLVGGLTSLLGDLIIIMIFWLFMIAGKTKFDKRIERAFLKYGKEINLTIISIDKQIQSYIFIKTVLSLLTGGIVTIALLIFGVDFPLVWGLLTFILNYIPNVGSIISTIPPILIALLQFGIGFNSIAIAALLASTQFVIGNLIEPKYMGKHLDLSPVFVLFSLIFWGWVWGIVGMFLAVPIAAIIKILLSNIDSLKPVAILIGSKGVLEEIKKEAAKKK